MTWACFLAVATDRAEQWLRRHVWPGDGSACPGGYRWHNGMVRIEDVAFPMSDYNGSGRDDWPHDDPRWPVCCGACSYVFAPGDEWQHIIERLYRRADGTGDPFTLRNAPPGAISDASWLLGSHEQRPTDADLQPGVYKGLLSRFYWQQWYGIRLPLNVRCPGPAGDWCVDQRANNGEGWVVTGTAPLLTASPSIKTPGYHGYLRDGVLTDDLEGRTYGPS